MKEVKQLVIGLGNEFRGDDAIGIFIIRKLQEEYPELAEYLIEQNDLTRILNRWNKRHVIIVDAVFSDSPSLGRIHEVESVNDLSSINKKQYSSHGLALSDIYDLGKSVDMIPQSIFMIGIEGSSWEIGSKMSEKLANAIPEVMIRVLQKLG